MYPDVSYVYLKCILDSFGIRVKYMQTVKIHVFSWNVTEHFPFKIHLRYIKIHPRYMYSTGYTHDTSRYIRIRIV